MVCPKCNEDNEQAARFCVGCGAPLQDGVDESEQSAYRNLASANLHRTRGDFKEAMDQCLAVLKRFPNNHTAHSLLGDISADQGDLEQAATWYEMALDLMPDSQLDKQKLSIVTDRIKARHAAEAAKQIGIPERAPRPWPMIVLVAVTVLAVGAGAYVIGQSQRGGAPKPGGLSAQSVTVGGGAPPQNQDTHDSDPPKNTSEPVSNPVPVGLDATLFRALQTQGQEQLVYLSALHDPRGPVATVSVQNVPNEDPKLTAGRAGLEFFRIQPSYVRVSLRVMGTEGPLCVADMTKDAAKTAEAAITGGDTLDSQAQVMLSNVWFPPAPESKSIDPNTPTSSPTQDQGEGR